MTRHHEELLEAFEGLEPREYAPGEHFATKVLSVHVATGKFEVTDAPPENEYIEGRHLAALVTSPIFAPLNAATLMFPGNGYKRVSIDFYRVDFMIGAASFPTESPSDPCIEEQELSFGSDDKRLRRLVFHARPGESIKRIEIVAGRSSIDNVRMST